MPFGFMLLHSLLKLVTGEQLEQLGENAAYSIHGGSLRTLRLVLSREPNPNYQRFRLNPKPNLDNPGACPAHTWQAGAFVPGVALSASERSLRKQ